MQTADRRPQSCRVVGEGAALRCLAQLARLAAGVAAFIFAFLVSALSARAQLIVELPDPTDTQVLPAPSGGPGDVLDIHGLGTAVLEEDADDFFGEVVISGAQLTLKGEGRLTEAERFLIQNGGTLFLDNSAVAHDDRLGSTADIALNAGTLAFDPGNFGFLSQELGYIDLLGGANQIDLYLGSVLGGRLFAETVWLADNAQIGKPTSTLNIRYIDPTGIAPINVRLEVDDDWGFPSIEGILPWATITRGSQVDWVQWEYGESTVFTPLTAYHTSTGSPADWNTGKDMLIEASTAELNDPGILNPQITSLKLANGGSLVLGEPGDLKIISGGLLSTGSTGNKISGRGSIWNGYDIPNTFYLHIHADLLVSGEIQFHAFGFPMIKTGEGTLRFTDDASIAVGSLVINQGIVAFEKNTRMELFEVIIGDGTGTDILELPASHNDPITNPSAEWDPGALPNITLHGTPYSTSPGSGAADAAILRFGGSTVQHAQLLHVEGRGTLDFVGGTIAKPNMLYLEEFTLADFDTALLFIRHWEDGRDVLLAHYENNKGTINAAFLARIKFEGYDAPAEWVSWGDGTYWEIRVAPEPHTYGAILGALGLGLFVWRKRKRGERAQHT